MKKIKIAQIGMGHDHATAPLNCFLKNSDVFEFVGLGLPESEKTDFADKIKNYPDVKIMTPEEVLEIPGLDAVAIETEEVNLTKYSTMAAEKGIAIHMDKPGGIELADFEKLIDTVKEKKTVFHLGYMYRYNPYIVELIEKIKSGVLGEIYAVEAHMSCEHSKEKRQWLGRFPGGMMFFLGCHLVDLVYAIKGKPDEVIAMNAPTGKDGVTADDYGMVVFKYKNGISFAKSCAAEPGGFMRRQLVVYGSKGTVEIKPLEAFHEDGSLYTEKSETYEGNGWCAKGEIERCAPYDRYDTMMKSFAAMVRGEKENPWDYDYELEVYKMVLRSCGVEI